MLEQRNVMMSRSLERQKNKKPKKTVLVPLPTLKSTAQKLVNRFCRERDRKYHFPCISCQKGPIEEGGHFWSMGSNSALRYCEDNIHGQCKACNRWGHGNLLNYRLNLVKKIGIKRVEWLDEHHSDIKKWTRDELLELIDLYKKKLENV